MQWKWRTNILEYATKVKKMNSSLEKCSRWISSIYRFCFIFHLNCVLFDGNEKCTCDKIVYFNHHLSRKINSNAKCISLNLSPFWPRITIVQYNDIKILNSARRKTLSLFVAQLIARWALFFCYCSLSPHPWNSLLHSFVYLFCGWGVGVLWPIKW